MALVERPAKKQCLIPGDESDSIGEGRVPAAQNYPSISPSLSTEEDTTKLSLLKCSSSVAGAPAPPAADRPSDEDGGLQRYHCDACQQDITHSFRVKCATCVDFDLCVPCFTAGVETSTHLNSHTYIPIGRGDIPIFADDWTADEEIMLLEGVSKFGFGNWSEIARLVSSVSNSGCKKRSSDCESHYYAVHVLPYKAAKGDSTIPNKAKLTRQSMHEKIIGKYNARPQAAISGGGSGGCSVVGYMPLRGDFDVEFDNDAELILSDIEFRGDETPQERELKLKVLDVYNAKLDERVVRKRVVVERRLADWRRIQQENRKRTKEEADLHSLFRLFARFDMAPDWEELVQLIVAERRLRERLTLLNEWKALSLKTYAEIEEYERCKQAVVSGMHPAQKQMLTAQANNQKNNETHAVSAVNLSGGREIQSHKLEQSAAQYPGGKLLTTTEQQFCDAMQLPPLYFFLVKHALLRAASENGDPAKLQEMQKLRLDAKRSGSLYDFILHTKIEEN